MKILSSQTTKLIFTKIYPWSYAGDIVWDFFPHWIDNVVTKYITEHCTYL